MAIEDIQSEILSHLVHFENLYSEYHVGDIASDCEHFFRHGDYVQSIVDVIVHATPSALKINQFIYQKDTRLGTVKVTEFLTHPTYPNVHLHFDYHPNYDHGNHYKPIIKNNGIIKVEDFQPYQHSQVTKKKESLRTQEQHFDSYTKEYRFPTYLFIGLRPTHVDFIPGNIDGMKLYKLSNVPERECWKSASDLRHFRMNTTRRKGLKGKIKIGNCSGSYECKNDNCPFINTNAERKRNEANWQYVEGRKVCKHCGVWGTPGKCNARKMIEYNTQLKEVTVYHLGKHTCTPKFKTAYYDKVMGEALSKHFKMGPVALKNMQVNEAVANGDIDGAYTIAEQLNTGRLKYLKRKKVKDLCPDTHSFEAVGILKKSTDKHDPYLIYRVNDSNCNDGPDLVFKSSKVLLQMAANMDQSGPQNALQEQVVYFDGTHSRCVGFKTLGLFFLHPGMRKLLRIASMEVRSEGTQNIHWFWKLLNSALREITSDSQAMFNPAQIMVDENGANFCGVREEFGLGYTLEKVVSCQMHFKADILKHMNKIGPSYREEFWKCVCELCTTPTESRYNELNHLLYQFAEFYPEVKNVLDFYDARKYHLFPAFRRFGYSGVTLAESGWAKVKRSGQLWLLDAARDDISTMIIQCSDIKKYNEQTQDVVGERAPTQAKQAAQARSLQISIARKFAEEFENADAFEQHLEESSSPNVFIPGPKARHKAGRGGQIYGRIIRGSGVRRGGRFGKRGAITRGGRGYGRHCTRARGRGRGGVSIGVKGRGMAGGTRGLFKKGHNNTSSNTIEDILRMGEEIMNEDITDFREEESSDGRRGGYNPVENPPTIVLFLGKSISKCQGCLGKIKRDVLTPPKDLCLTCQDFRSYYCQEDKIQKTYYGNIYFHLTMNCLQRKYPKAVLDDVTIGDDTLCLLSTEHLKYLKVTGFLETALRKKRKNLTSN